MIKDSTTVVVELIVMGKEEKKNVSFYFNHFFLNKNKNLLYVLFLFSETRPPHNKDETKKINTLI